MVEVVGRPTLPHRRGAQNWSDPVRRRAVELGPYAWHRRKVFPIAASIGDPFPDVINLITRKNWRKK